MLDDSTAAIDPATEQRVRAALQSSLQNTATIIIAHRLSSLKHADQIIVLDEGRIVERGSHAELSAAGGRYAELWSLQNRGAQEGLTGSTVSAAINNNNVEFAS